MGLIFRTSWRVAPTKKKLLYGDLDFSKKVSKESDFGSILEPKFELFFI